MRGDPLDRLATVADVAADWKAERLVSTRDRMGRGGARCPSHSAPPDASPDTTSTGNPDAHAAGSGPDARAGLSHADPAGHINAALYQRSLADHDRSLGRRESGLGDAGPLRDQRGPGMPAPAGQSVRGADRNEVK